MFELIDRQPIPPTQRAVERMTLMQQSRDMQLQLQILVLLGLHGELTLLEIGSYIYDDVADEELPVATLTLALLALRQDRLVRSPWFISPRRYHLAREGRRLHRYLVQANEAHVPFGFPVRV